MAWLDDLEKVVRLACLTEDRTRGEQSALRRVAARVDRDFNSKVSTNRRRWSFPHVEREGFVESRLVEIVDEGARA